jgi:hypothetical protein
MSKKKTPTSSALTIKNGDQPGIAKPSEDNTWGSFTSENAVRREKRRAKHIPSQGMFL